MDEYRKSKQKNGSKNRSKLGKDISKDRKSADGRKAAKLPSKLPRNHKLKVSYEAHKGFKEQPQRNHTIHGNKLMQSGNFSTTKGSLMYISDERRVSSKTRLKRIHSSKPLRVSLKDLDWVKKLKEKMTKKSKKSLKQPKMYISDRPAKGRKVKKTMALGSSRNSFSNSMKDMLDKQRGESRHETSRYDSLKREASKHKATKGKKKKKAKRESLNSKPIESLKSNLIQTSKFSTFEISKRNRNQEMRLEDLGVEDVTIKQSYEYTAEGGNLDLKSSDDDVLVGSATNLASSDRNPAETTEETTPKATEETDRENPNFIEVLNMDQNKENRR